MTRTLGVLTAALLTIATLVAPQPARAATPITVTQAIATQNGTTPSVRGYVVGQPTATSTVVKSGFPNDYALALADSASETSTSKMIYVQIPSAFRSAWGLKTNPGLMGDLIDVTGTLASYFSRPGLTGGTAFAAAGTGGGGGGTTSPWDSTYYATAIGQAGPQLRSALHSIIDGNTRVSYSTVWTALMQTDQDPANSNNVIELYSGRSVPKNTNGGDPDDWNREHVWPQSHGDFGTSAGPGTDLHHLRPEDVTVNSTRGNKDFDDGGTAVSQCTGCLTDSNSFEPRDAVKGDVARMVFYMAIRYEGDDGFANLELNNLTNGTVPLLGRISILLQWNAEDPVSTFEMRRNDLIHSNWQGNRNPFIDHPEWAQAIWAA